MRVERSYDCPCGGGMVTVTGRLIEGRAPTHRDPAEGPHLESVKVEVGCRNERMLDLSAYVDAFEHDVLNLGGGT